MLAGFAPPYTPSGRSALIPPPPWHYAGTVLSVAYEADDTAAAAALLPADFGRPTGRCVVHVCDWQATTDGSDLLDPIQAQYREVIHLLEAERAEGTAFFCPFIYVDQDLSLVRGWLLGSPTLLGERPSAGTPRFVRARVSAFEVGPLTPARAELRLFDSPRDEVALLAPRGSGVASIGEVALTVEGAIAEGGA